MELCVSERRAHARGMADAGRQGSLPGVSCRGDLRDPGRAPAIPRGPPRDPLRHRHRCRRGGGGGGDHHASHRAAEYPAGVHSCPGRGGRARARGSRVDSGLLTALVNTVTRFDAQGVVEPGCETVREASARVLTEQRGTGAALAVWHEGRWIVDLWGGAASADGTRAWQRDSIVQPYSVSKPFAAMCALVLVDRGVLDLDAPIQRYWPEFRAPATPRHVLSHQAGVVALDAAAPTSVFYDWHALCALLADQRSAPPGLDFAVGLTADDQARAVELTCLDDIEPHAGELYRRATANPPGTRDPALVNGAAWRTAEVPAINGHGTARGIAGLYAALLRGELLSPQLLREAVSVQCSGVDRVFGHENA